MNIPKKEQGQGLVEYALILVLVAVVVILVLQILGSAVTVVYVRVIGGLNGQVLSGVGTEYLVSGVNVSTAGAGLCTVTISNVTVVAFNNGNSLANTNISVPVTASGGSPTSLNGTTDNNGVASGLSKSFGAACSGTLTIGNYSTSY